MKLAAFSILILVLVIGVDGCSSSNGPANTVSWAIPNPGSYFVMGYIDSLYNGSDTFVVISSGVINGRENTISFGGSRYLPFHFMSYAPNGDIYICSDVGARWSRFPTGGDTSFDSVYNSYTYYGTYDLMKTFRTYNGTGTITIGGREFSTIKIHEVDSEFQASGRPGNIIVDTGSETIDYNFIPSIGFEGSDFDTTAGQWSIDALVSYVLN